MKSLRSTLILLLIVAVIGGYIYFNERGPVAQSGSTVLLRTDPSRIDTITLTGTNTRLVLVKHKEQWKIRAAKSDLWPADPDAVQGLLDQLQLLQAPSALPSTSDKLKEYGLDKPHSTLKVDNATITFGNQLPFDATRVYARVEQSGSTLVGLVPSTLTDALSKPVDAWRDRAVLRVDVKNAEHIQVRAPVVKADFERQNSTHDEESNWLITKPVQARAASGVVQTFLEQLPQTQTTKFLEDVPGSLARWGLDKPLATVQVAGGDNIAELHIGRKTSGGYAAQNSLSPCVFEVPPTLFALIDRPLREWRAKELLNFEVDKITQLEISARGQKLSFQNSDGKWIRKDVRTPSDKQAQHQAALDVLLALQGLNAQEFIDDARPSAAYGLDKPTLQLNLSSAQWRGITTISLAAKNGKTYAYTREVSRDGKTVYVLPPSAIDAFKPALDVLLPQPKSAPTTNPATIQKG